MLHMMSSLLKASGFGLGSLGACWAAGEALLRPLLPVLPAAGVLMSSKTLATCPNALTGVSTCLFLLQKTTFCFLPLVNLPALTRATQAPQHIHLTPEFSGQLCALRCPGRHP